MFREKALENKQAHANDMNEQNRLKIENAICQNSDKMQGQNIDKVETIKPIEDFEEDKSPENEEEPPIVKNITPFEKTERALEIEK